MIERIIEIGKANPYHDPKNGRFTTGPSGSKLNLKTDCTDAYGGEIFNQTTAYIGDKVAGYLKYSVYDGTPSVQYIETSEEFKRQGVATQLMQELQRQYPDTEIDFGMTTPDGSKFIESITYEVKNPKVIADKRKLSDLKEELKRTEKELDEVADQPDSPRRQARLDELGERWEQLYDTEIPALEEQLRGKKESQTFVKLEKSDSESEEMEEQNEFSIYKTDDDKRLVFGWASISIAVDGEQLEDRQKDIIDPEDLEEAVYDYVLNFRDTGEEHIPTMRKKGKLVESCVFTADKQKAMGIPEGILPIGWWIGFHIDDDDAWERVKNGTYKMFSIEGKGERKPVEKSAPVAKTFNEILEIEKFNPYHDRLGRFATAGGATSFTYSPGKSKAHDNAIAREKERQATANQGKPLRNPTGDYEIDRKREWEGADRAYSFSKDYERYGSTQNDSDGSYGNQSIFTRNGSWGQIYMLTDAQRKAVLTKVQNEINAKGIRDKKEINRMLEKEMKENCVRTIDQSYFKEQLANRRTKKSIDTIAEVDGK